LIISEKSKKEKILPLRLTDNAILKRNISKDQVIRIEDIELNLLDEVIEARNYLYDLL
jgi:predicted homoserine dehydrogenase-like protein